MDSVWTETARIGHFNRLEGDIRADVLIIGGGMAGVLCAHFLAQAGIDYVLLEGARIGGGVTKNTTAKITAQHGLLYDGLIRAAGEEKAGMYLGANLDALKEYSNLCQNIDCDFETKDAYVYSMQNAEGIELEAEALQKLGYQAEVVETLPLPFTTAGAVKFPEQAQFHPLKFLAKISSGLNIYEDSLVRKIKGNKALTDHGSVTATKIIVATHFPFINKHGSYFLKMYQHRSYVVALKDAPSVNGMYVDEAQCGMSFRNHKELLFIGGADHKTGKQGQGWQPLRDFAGKHYPDAKEKCYWATQDCMSLDGVPYIGQYSASTPNLYVATGFNKWGMTSSMVAGMLLRDILLGKQNAYAPVFSPSRTILKPQLAVNAFQAMSGLLNFMGPRCPHMGCALKWNKAEHSWDCPCHGSRFDSHGRRIDNPANKNLKDTNLPTE